MYRMDLDASQLEMRISRLMSTDVDPIYIFLTEKHEKLRHRVTEMINDISVVTQESDRNKDLAHAIYNEIQGHKHEQEILATTLYDINLVCAKYGISSD